MGDNLTRRDLLTLAPAAGLAAAIPTVASSQLSDPHVKLWAKRNAFVGEADILFQNALESFDAGASTSEVRAIEDKANQIMRCAGDVEDEIFNTPATSMEGLNIQIELVRENVRNEFSLEAWEAEAFCVSLSGILEGL